MDVMTAALIAVQENADRLKGEPGTKGEAGGPGKAGDPGLEWRGPWATSETYVPGDAVELDGSSYVAVQPSKNQRPPSGVWDLLALKGAPGPPGRRGGGGGNAGAGGGAPSGPAGGDLAGTYPNPSVTDDSHAHTGATLPAQAVASVNGQTGVVVLDADDVGAIPQGGPLTEALDAGGERIINLGAPGDPNDAARYADVALPAVLNASNDADGFAIVNMADPTDPQDAATKAYADTKASQSGFDDHSARHEDGGADEISLTGLSGTPADLTTHAAAADPHTGYVREADAMWIDLTDSGATTLHSHAGAAGVTWISIARWGL